MYCGVELLDGNNQYRCERCNCLVDAKRVSLVHQWANGCLIFSRGPVYVLFLLFWHLIFWDFCMILTKEKDTRYGSVFGSLFLSHLCFHSYLLIFIFLPFLFYYMYYLITHTLSFFISLSQDLSRFQFPQSLNMSPYLDCQKEDENTDAHIYDLFSVVIHSGSTHSGHYIAYIKDIDQIGVWTPPVSV